MAVPGTSLRRIALETRLTRLSARVGHCRRYLQLLSTSRVLTSTGSRALPRWDILPSPRRSST